MTRIHNFSAGPSALPTAVLERARDELLDWGHTGMSVMEMSHRSKDYVAIAEKAEADLRELLAVPDGYRVLFLQGGATGQFAAIPMNLLRGRASAAYVNTGIWSKKAIAEAKHYATVKIAASGEVSGFCDIPPEAEWTIDPAAAYLHYTSNETIGGVEFQYVPDGAGLPLVADMSSNILSRPIDISRFGLVYAGAQKNMGPAGITVVIVRDDFIGGAQAGTPSILDYRQQADNGSSAMPAAAAAATTAVSRKRPASAGTGWATRCIPPGSGSTSSHGPCSSIRRRRVNSAPPFSSAPTSSDPMPVISDASLMNCTSFG